MSRISFNIHAQTAGLDKNRLLLHMERSQPPFALVMDGLQLGKDIQNVSPKTQIIHRSYPDENIWREKTPAQWIELKKREVGDNRFYLYTVNEQGLSDNLCDWFTEVIEQSESSNMKLIVGNLSAGTPQASDWTRPAVIRFLKACDKHRSRVILGTHEYACGVITSGFLGGWPDNAGVAPVPDNKGKGRNLVPSANWPERKEVDQITRFHCGRFKFLVEACKLLNIPPPRIVLTEHGFDDMSDIKTWALLQQQTPPYTSFRGWKSLEAFWRSNYSAQGWTPQRAMFEQLAYADRVLYQNSPVEGQCVFCWGHTSDMWTQFDISGAGEFLTLVEGQATPTPVPSPQPEPIPAPIPTPVPVPTTPPLELEALRMMREQANQVSNQTRRMSLELAAISDDLLKSVRMLDALLKLHEPQK